MNLKLALRFFVYFLFSLLLIGCHSTQPLQSVPPVLPSKPLETANHNAHAIYNVLPNYAEIKREKWEVISVDKLPLKLGMRDPKIPDIRHRLITLGDLTYQALENSDFYDTILGKAVEHFQWRHGLKPDGEIGQNTLDVLNVSPEQRYQQLILNMKRWAEIPDGVGSNYILVNIPSYQLDLIKEGNVIVNMKVIVGRPDRPTPVLYSQVKRIRFNPPWNIPETIVKNDVIPKTRSNPNFLTENNIEVFKTWRRDSEKLNPKEINWKKWEKTTVPYRLTQTAGGKNPLGKVKFIFLNEHDVYLHDTPEKGTFVKMFRAMSSGCVRLEKPMELVEYFIQNNTNLDRKEIDTLLSSGETKYLALKNPIPIYITYITAWVDKQGIVHFSEDVYKKDKEVQK